MQPKWQAIEFPQSCTAYGESALQPFLDSANAVVVAGGSRGLYMVDAHQVQDLLFEIPARVHITGFAVHSGELYVQDGPVLSRWSLSEGKCIAATNLVNTVSWQGEGAGPNWAALHKLDTEKTAHQNRLQKARRGVEWLTLLEHCEAEAARNPSAELQRLKGLLSDAVGPDRQRIRAELDDASTAAAALIFSPPVVRAHQVGGKAGAMVFVVARGGTLHLLDARLHHKGSKFFDRNVRPMLALGEWETDAHSDDFACRLFYVKEDGGIRALDADAMPPQSVGEWPAQGPSSLAPGVRARVDAGLLWGSAAQGTGIFALPAGVPGAASRVVLPLTESWRWLEVFEKESLALVSTEGHSQLVSFAPGRVSADRFGRQLNRAPFFATFLRPVDGRPLLVLEVDRESDQADVGVRYRLVVANTIDQQPSNPFYPPAPVSIADGVLEGFSTESAPMHVRSQPWISREDAYIIARDASPRQQIQALMKTVRPFDAAESPPLIGTDALHCYPVGSSVTRDQATRAWTILDQLRNPVEPIRVRIMRTTNSYGRIDGPRPVTTFGVSLRFSNGKILMVTPDAAGYVTLPPHAAFHMVTMLPVMPVARRREVTTCQLFPGADNVIHQTSIDE